MDPKFGPFCSKCKVLIVDDSCPKCGVDFSEECPLCGCAGHHDATCSEIVVPEAVDLVQTHGHAGAVQKARMTADLYFPGPERDFWIAVAESVEDALGKVGV